MAKIIGSALPNIPWQEPPANTRTPAGWCPIGFHHKAFPFLL